MPEKSTLLLGIGVVSLIIRDAKGFSLLNVPAVPSRWRPRNLGLAPTLGGLSILARRTTTTTSSSSTIVGISSTLRASDMDGGNDENDDNDWTLSSTTGHRPIGVTLKIAVDLNGGVAELDTEASERFTSPTSLDMVHRLRRDCDAVLVGRGTVQADNPSLTVRRVQPRFYDEEEGTAQETIEETVGSTEVGVCHESNQKGMFEQRPIQPLRVVLDPTFSLALEQFANEKRYRIFDDGYPTVVYHTMGNVDDETLAFLESVEFVQLPSISSSSNASATVTPTTTSTRETDDDEMSQSTISEQTVAAPEANRRSILSVANIMSDLSHRYHVKHLMVEGGPTTAQSFLKAGLVDRVLLVKAPVRFRQPLASGITPTVLQQAGLQFLGTYESDADVIECWSRSNLPWPAEDIQSWP